MKTLGSKREIQAFEIMTQPVETVRINDSIHDVSTLFTENNISAAVVLDRNEKPIGVITKTDIVRYEKERNGNSLVDKKELPKMEGSNRSGFHVMDDDETVENWMNPIIFAVKRDTSLKEIARRMVRYGIHHIFVQGMKGEPIVGIVSSFDVLKQVATGMCNDLNHKPR